MHLHYRLSAGTLTQDKIILMHHVDLHGQESNRVLEYAYLNSHYQSGLKNLLDVAVLDQSALRGGPGFDQNRGRL